MRILVACEVSGKVRDAFIAKGHDAVSCDLVASDRPGPHIVGDVREAIAAGPWDMLIAFPPCTRLANSGVRWLSQPPAGRTRDEMQADLELGAALFSACLNAPIARIAIENPVMHKHAKLLIRNYVPFTQSIQPWQFGHGETKRTCLWLKGLAPLQPTCIVSGRDQRVWRMSPGALRAKQRSETFDGIARAMSEAWG